ncbi:hypothetical protein Ssi03_09290 [Sphaerisporangium siamense]|nr:hypothetical protein Ssi03_09290 [Sphaerisporangium siamense]
MSVARGADLVIKGLVNSILRTVVIFLGWGEFSHPCGSVVVDHREPTLERRACGERTAGQLLKAGPAARGKPNVGLQRGLCCGVRASGAGQRSNVALAAGPDFKGGLTASDHDGPARVG